VCIVPIDIFKEEREHGVGGAASQLFRHFRWHRRKKTSENYLSFDSERWADEI
jgi:hypothetical protein